MAIITEDPIYDVAFDLLEKVTQFVFVSPFGPDFVFLAHELAWKIVYEKQRLDQLSELARVRLEQKPMLWRYVKNGRSDSDNGKDFLTSLRRGARLLVHEALWGGMSNCQRKEWARMHLDWTGIEELKDPFVRVPGDRASCIEGFIEIYFGRGQGFKNMRRLLHPLPPRSFVTEAEPARPAKRFRKDATGTSTSTDVVLAGTPAARELTIQLVHAYLQKALSADAERQVQERPRAALEQQG